MGRKIIARWWNMEISLSFSTWADNTAHRKVVQLRMRKMLVLWTNRSISTALQRWIEHTADLVRLKTVTFRVMARWQNKTVSTMFWVWAERWSELKARIESAEQSKSRVRAVTYRMTFDPKKSDPSMMVDLKRFETSLFADLSQVLAPTCSTQLLPVQANCDVAFAGPGRGVQGRRVHRSKDADLYQELVAEELFGGYRVPRRPSMCRANARCACQRNRQAGEEWIDHPKISVVTCRDC